ncbi:hypothetical protein KP615_09710 [Treponema denticola]|jgi:Uncharacterized protein, homolog of phage Mu protein gp30|uniref:phage head morphogenesis protein n=1 Tax=Treponema denticola TaxID=158 RepID=UPI0020528B7C|nr:MAG TPA: minor capsid component [Caudoviricetes sp.]
MSDNFIPKEALDYIKNKNLKVGFSYKDVWNEEHATAFTVAKAMQIDVLSDLKKAVEKAIEDGQSFETFKKNIKPTLQQKGWWGKKKMTDPLTGEVIDAQLGSDRRLKTIYNVNLRSAYQKGQYDRTMTSDSHPYLIYRVGNSVKHRDQHLAWNGLTLPKDDPFWDSHFPPNGYGCKCYTRAVSEARKKKYESEGIKIPPTVDGSGGGILKIKTKPPIAEYKQYFNERKGYVEKIPKGITPGFNWNQGNPRTESVKYILVEKLNNFYNGTKKIIESVAWGSPEYKRQERHAKLYYDEIRKRKTDVKKIAENTKMSTAKIEAIKKHIFFTEHEIDGEKVRFSESYKISEAWRRLQTPNFLIEDLILLNHEYLELTLMQNLGYTYSQAHEEANKKFNWAKLSKNLKGYF